MAKARPASALREATREEKEAWDSAARRLAAAEAEAEAEWAATARGRTDEQRLLEYLGISHSEIGDYLVDSPVSEKGEPMCRLLVHLGIECLKGGYEYPYSEARFGSIREYFT